MASKAIQPTQVVDELNDGWSHVVGPDGQGELVQTDQVTGGNGNGHKPAGAPAPDVWATLGEPLLVPLASIEPNPYQPRQAEDPAAIAEIALSIYRNGLMQIPAARTIDGRFQLAFGHTRKSAFDLLSTIGLPEHSIGPDGRFAMMPLRIVDLNDQQMFEVAVAENLKRRELNTMELAAAMKRYMDEFKVSSRKVAELFGISDATVRGTIRLLNLPEKVQTQIAAGEITQGAGRQLLTVSRIAGAEAIESAASSISEGMSADEAICNTMRANNRTIIEMWDRWMAGRPRGGRGLWYLDEMIPADRLPELTVKELAKQGLETTPKTRLAFYLTELTTKFEKYPGIATVLAEANRDDAEAIERIEHLLRPPACMDCPFHVSANKAHYCGNTLCHKRKDQAWSAIEIEQIAERLSIPIYDPEADGQVIADLLENEWSDAGRAHAKLVEENAPELRLAIVKGNGRHKWTESYRCAIVLIGQAAQELVEKRTQAEAKRKAETQQRNQTYEREHTLRTTAVKFFEENVPPLFASAFDGLTNPAVLCALLGQDLPSEKVTKEDLAQMRVELSEQTINTYQAMREGPISAAKYYKNLAKTWGIKLEVDLVKLAKPYEPIFEGVSTETPEPESDEEIDDDGTE